MPYSRRPFRYTAGTHTLGFTIRELGHIDLVSFIKSKDNHQRLAQVCVCLGFSFLTAETGGLNVIGKQGWNRSS